MDLCHCLNATQSFADLIYCKNAEWRGDFHNNCRSREVAGKRAYKVAYGSARSAFMRAPHDSILLLFIVRYSLGRLRQRSNTHKILCSISDKKVAPGSREY